MLYLLYHEYLFEIIFFKYNFKKNICNFSFLILFFLSSSYNKNILSYSTMVKSRFSRRQRTLKRRRRYHAHGGGPTTTTSSAHTHHQHVVRPNCAVPATTPTVPNCIPDVDVSAFKTPCKALSKSPLFAPFPCPSSTHTVAKHGGRRRYRRRQSKRSRRY